MTLQHDTATRYFSEIWSACAPSIWHTHTVRNSLTRRMHSMCIKSMQSRGWLKSWSCAACAASYMTHTQSPLRHKKKKERYTRVSYSYNPEVWIEWLWLRSWLRIDVSPACTLAIYTCGLQCAAVCCIVLQYSAVLCSVLQYVKREHSLLSYLFVLCSALLFVLLHTRHTDESYMSAKEPYRTPEKAQHTTES